MRVTCHGPFRLQAFMPIASKERAVPCWEINELFLEQVNLGGAKEYFISSVDILGNYLGWRFSMPRVFQSRSSITMDLNHWNSYSELWESSQSVYRK
jgi:hypothetical protein